MQQNAERMGKVDQGDLGGLILVGIAVGIGTGRVEELSQTILGERKATRPSWPFLMIGIYCLWMGLLRIAEKSGMIQAIARGSERLICSKLFTRNPPGQRGGFPHHPESGGEYAGHGQCRPLRPFGPWRRFRSKIRISAAPATI